MPRSAGSSGPDTPSSANGGSGGGIYTEDLLWAQRTMILDNRTGNGGATAGSGSVTAARGGNAGDGGGIYVRGPGHSSGDMERHPRIARFYIRV